MLIGFALALRPLDLPGEVKALILVITAVTASFALALPLVTRTSLRRIL